MRALTDMATAGGQRLGRYELIARLATGGMGEIFLARLAGPSGFEKLCVIKRILPHLADDARFRAMFVGEARIVANMSHANVCHGYELAETGRQLFLVMEYLEGMPLLAVLRKVGRERRQLPLGAVAGILQQAAEGLHYAHELGDLDGRSLGIIHRDVTPSNIFLTSNGIVKIYDFGVAKAVDAASATDTGAVKGKFAYMAPEQLRGQPLDRRADLFALGAVAFETLTCQPLFQGKTDYLTFRAVIDEPLPDLRARRAGVPDALVAVIERALARDREARFPTVREFATALVDAIEPVERAWSQSAISELVHAEFADDLRRRKDEVAAAASAAGRRSVPMPVIAAFDDDYFSIETSEVHPRSQAAASTVRRWWSRRWPIAGIGAAALLLVVGLAVIETRSTGGAPSTLSADDQSLRAHATALSACARTHGTALLPGTTAALAIGRDGRVERVELRPDVAGDLGRCLRRALQAVTFAPAPVEKDLELALALRP